MVSTSRPSWAEIASRPWCPLARRSSVPSARPQALAVSGTPTVVVLPGPPRELQPMWEKAVPDRGCAGGDRRSHRVPAEHHSHVRPARDGSRRNPARRRGWHHRLRSPGDHPPAYGGVSWRSSRATSPTSPRLYDHLVGLLRERHGRQLFSEDGSLVDDQVPHDCWRAARWRRPNPARREGCFPPGLPTVRVRRTTSRGGVLAYSTRRRPSCSASSLTCSPRTGRCPSPSPRRWPTAR